MAHPAKIPIDELVSECEFRRTRRSGPGGQHRNKVETAVVVEHLPTATKAEANERRSQELNRKAAIHRLRVKLAYQHRTSAEESPSALWCSRAVDGKLSVNSEHEDFPALLAEAMDVIASCKFDVSLAAHRLGVSTSQLVKFLKLEPEGLILVNREREVRGLTKYR